MTALAKRLERLLYTSPPSKEPSVKSPAASQYIHLLFPSSFLICAEPMAQSIPIVQPTETDGYRDRKEQVPSTTSTTRLESSDVLQLSERLWLQPQSPRAFEGNGFHTCRSFYLCQSTCGALSDNPHCWLQITNANFHSTRTFNMGMNIYNCGPAACGVQQTVQIIGDTYYENGATFALTG